MWRLVIWKPISLMLGVALLICLILSFWPSTALCGADTVWTRKYNGPGNATDRPNWITVDPGGNVYVTGWSAGADSDYDYATVKYDGDGNELWNARYNGPLDTADYAGLLSVDNSGNVYVVGLSAGTSGTSTRWDVATVKYDSEGHEKWVRREVGYPWDKFPDYFLGPYIAVDQNGSVYVAGCGPDILYFLVKYNPNGDRVWVIQRTPVDVVVGIAFDASRPSRYNLWI